MPRRRCRSEEDGGREKDEDAEADSLALSQTGCIPAADPLSSPPHHRDILPTSTSPSRSPRRSRPEAATRLPVVHPSGQHLSIPARTGRPARRVTLPRSADVRRAAGQKVNDAMTAAGALAIQGTHRRPPSRLLSSPAEALPTDPNLPRFLEVSALPLFRAFLIDGIDGLL